MPHENYPSIPVFDVDTTRVEAGGCIIYTLISPASAEFVTWEFEGGDPSYWSAGSEFPPPPIYYYSTGTFDVSVQTYSMGWGCTNFSEDYITVLDPVKINPPKETVRFTVLPNPAKDYLIINLNPEINLNKYAIY